VEGRGDLISGTILAFFREEMRKTMNTIRIIDVPVDI
jgi:hypothetical protein